MNGKNCGVTLEDTTSFKQCNISFSNQLVYFSGFGEKGLYIVPVDEVEVWMTSEIVSVNLEEKYVVVPHCKFLRELLFNEGPKHMLSWRNRKS